MPAFDNIGFYVLVAVMAGLVIGAVLFRSISGRHAHYNDVRWRRRFSEMQAEHELSIATLTKTLRHAQDKQSTLRQALDESDETIRLLSADGSTTFEQDIADRNNRIGELKKTLSHARAMLADSQDHETTLQRRVGELQNELDSRDQRIDELQKRNTELSDVEMRHSDQATRDTNLQTELETARTALHDREQQLAEVSRRLESHVAQTTGYQDESEKQESQITRLQAQLEDMRQVLLGLTDSLHEHQASIADLETDLSRERHKTTSLEQTIEQIYSTDNQPEEAIPGRANVISIHDHILTDDLVATARSDDDNEQRIRALESELHEWKRKYEAASDTSDRPAFDPSATSGDTARNPDRREKKDDLKQIRGIGPALESALNKLGFFQYEQLADMGQRDIEQIGLHDTSLPGRIRRYKWVEQARKLHKTYYSRQQHRDI